MRHTSTRRRFLPGGLSPSPPLVWRGCDSLDSPSSRVWGGGSGVHWVPPLLQVAGFIGVSPSHLRCGGSGVHWVPPPLRPVMCRWWGSLGPPPPVVWRWWGSLGSKSHKHSMRHPEQPRHPPLPRPCGVELAGFHWTPSALWRGGGGVPSMPSSPF